MGARLRIAKREDAAAIERIYTPIVNETIISFEYEPPSVSELAERIEGALEHYPWLVCDDGDDVLGYAYATRFRGRAAYDWVVEVSVYVAPGAQRRGVARALYTALFELLTAQGFTRAFAGIALPNASSVALHEGLGFEPIGTFPDVGYKFDAWHAVGFWHRALAEPGKVPAEPRSFVRLRTEPRTAAMLERAAALVRTRGD